MAEHGPIPTERPEVELRIDKGPIAPEEPWLVPLLGEVALTDTIIAELNEHKAGGAVNASATSVYSRSVDGERKKFYGHPVFGWTQEDHALHPLFSAFMSKRMTSQGLIVRLPNPDTFVACCRMMATVVPVEALGPVYLRLRHLFLYRLETFQNRLIQVSEAGHDIGFALQNLPTKVFTKPNNPIPPSKGPSLGAILLVKPKPEPQPAPMVRPLDVAYGAQPSDELHDIIEKTWGDIDSSQVVEYLGEMHDSQAWQGLTVIAKSLARDVVFQSTTARGLARALQARLQLYQLRQK